MAYTVTFDTGGGSSVAPLTDQTALPTPLPTPTKANHVFAGWYYDNLFTQKATAGDELTADVTLYAKWYTPTSWCEDIADAIREKEGSSEPIKHVDFADRIRAIQNPTLNAPTISISGDTLTITPNTNNGNFATGYKVYSDGSLIDTIQTTTLDLSTHLTEVGTYAITVKAYGTNFNDSVASNSENYVIVSGFDVTIDITNDYNGGSVVGNKAIIVTLAYSIDNGSNWVSILTETANFTVNAVTQIKFKAQLNNGSDALYIGTALAIGSYNDILNSVQTVEQISDNLTVSANTTYYISMYID